jgi:hypothetical protein
MWVAAQVAGVFRTGDGGETWMPANAGLPQPEEGQSGPAAGYCVHKMVGDPRDPEALYLQHRDGVFASHDGAVTWRRIDQRLPRRFGFPICVTRAGELFVVPLESAAERFPPADRLRVYRSRNGGADWDPLGRGLPDGPQYAAVLRDALATDTLEPPGIYFGTTAGEVFASADAGERWQALPGHYARITAVATWVLAERGP